MLSFIKTSFRDVADRDYIAARILYRHDLKLQFLWSSLQAIEKYLKSVLLFNGRSAKGYGHDLEKLFSALPKEIPDINFDFPADVEDFVRYLAKFGANRYFDNPFGPLWRSLGVLPKNWTAPSRDSALPVRQRPCRHDGTTIALSFRAHYV